MSYARINSAKLNALLMAKSEEAAMRAAEIYRENVRREIAMSGRVQTGEMMSYIRLTPNSLTTKASVRVTPKAEHFKFQDQGTKGSEAGPGKVLRFRPKGSAVFIFRPRSGPISPGHFLQKARLRMRPEDWS